MKTLRPFAGLCVAVLSIAAASPAFGLANRVFVSARSGNNANSCDNVNTPCQTFAGAVSQLNPNGEAIVLDSGGYGPVTITQGVTIEAPAGVTAFIHPPSGDAITVAAGSATVTLRGLVLNVGTNSGITVLSVGTLNVENCFITGFVNYGIEMNSSGGRLNLKGTDIKSCAVGVYLTNTSGLVQASVDHCHFDGNADGYFVASTSPGSSTTTATHTTANSNNYGWICGNGDSGKAVINLESCTASENAVDGIYGNNLDALSAVRYSSCVFANNGSYGVERAAGGSGTFESRGNNTMTGNGLGPTFGVIGSFLSM